MEPGEATAVGALLVLHFCKGGNQMVVALCWMMRKEGFQGAGGWGTPPVSCQGAMAGSGN